MSASGLGRREMITPREQVNRIQAPIIEELTKVLRIDTISGVVAQYLEPPGWYTALQRIDMLPPLIPALPRYIHQVLNGKCPIQGDKAGIGMNSLKIRQTHSLYLIPPGTTNELEARVKAYGEAHLSEYGGKNPLQFYYFDSEVRRKYGDIRFNEPQWILVSNGVLPGSRNQHYARQIAMVEELSNKAFVNFEVPPLRPTLGLTFLPKVAIGESFLQAASEKNRESYTYTLNYEVPSLREAAGLAFLHKVATEESFLQADNGKIRDDYTYTITRETGSGGRLIVGGHSPSGLFIDSPPRLFGWGSAKSTGVLPLWKL